MIEDQGSPPSAEGLPLHGDLSQEARYFRRLADALPHLVWVRLPGGEVEFANIAWSRYTGLPPDTPLEEALARVIHPDDARRMGARRDPGVARGEPYDVELRLLRHDGVYRWHHARIEPMRGPAGQIERWVGTCTDIHDRKKTAAQLDALLDGATVGIALFDPELRYLRINEALAQIHGVPAEAHLGRTLDEVVPALGAQVTPLLRLVLRTGEPYVHSNFVTPLVGGSERSFYFCYFPVRVEAGVVGVAAIVIELTDRVRAEQGYALVARATNDVLWDWDLRTDRVRWSEAVHSRLGYPPAAVEEEPGWWAARVHPEDRERVVGELRRAIAGGKDRWSCEYRFARADGSHAPVLDRGFIARDGLGRPVRFVGSMFDQTEQRRREAELAAEITERTRTEQALSLLAEAGQALSASLDVEELLGHVGRLLVPKLGDLCVLHLRGDDGSFSVPFVAHVDAEAEAQVRALLARDGEASPERLVARPYALTARTGASTLCVDVEAKIREVFADAPLAERLRALRLTSFVQVPLPVQGAVLGALSIATWAGSGRRFDERDLRLAEELGRRVALALDNARLLELSRSERARVEEASRARDEFLGMVSHELRTPLQAILGWARVLRRHTLGEDQRQRAIEAIDRNATAQAQLIRDLLDVTRIITGKLQLQVGPVELVQVAEAALDIVRPAAEAKGVVLSLQADPPVIPLVADGDRLQQVVWNLLANGVKFTERGGRVDMRLSLDAEGRALVTVCDTGKGIGADFLPFLFEKFRQEDVGATRRHGGLGLGLAIVRHLVEGHGGTIEAASEGEGRGALFTVRLPARASSVGGVSAVVPVVDRPGSGPELAAAPDLAGLRVLVVDDERDARELVAEVLRRAGAAVLLAESGEEAMTRVAADRPDVIVSDIAMPGESGYGWIRRLRVGAPESGSRTPALALTAFARLEDRAQARLAGFEKHLSKPVEPHELVAAIAELARR